MSKTLLPVNATQEERDIESTIARQSDIPVDIGKLWNPDTCPAELLPWLAWALSVDEWDSNWSETNKRDFIKQSATVHRHKGTVGAVRNALASLGVTVDFLEWFENTHDVALAPIRSTVPHTFVFIAWANENPYTSHEVFLNDELYATVTRVVEQVKPVRSHFGFLVGARLDSTLLMATALTGRMQVARLTSETVPVKIPTLQTTLSAILHLNQRRYCVARWYLSE